MSEPVSEPDNSGILVGMLQMLLIFAGLLAVWTGAVIAGAWVIAWLFL